MWIGTMVALNCGGTVITQRTQHLDADALLQCVVDNEVTDLTIVGDAFARPILAALDAQRRAKPYDLSRVGQIASSGVMWSSKSKRPSRASGYGAQRHHGLNRGLHGRVDQYTRQRRENAKFSIAEYVKVFNEDDEPVAPGSGEMGMVATAGIVPRGYYKDEEKSARTFRTVNGVRYSFPGDFATVEADGSITLLGRGLNASTPVVKKCSRKRLRSRSNGTMTWRTASWWVCRMSVLATESSRCTHRNRGPHRLVKTGCENMFDRNSQVIKPLDKPFS